MEVKDVRVARNAPSIVAISDAMTRRRCQFELALTWSGWAVRISPDMA
jgi:hypothetical protein